MFSARGRDERRRGGAWPSFASRFEIDTRRLGLTDASLLSRHGLTTSPGSRTAALVLQPMTTFSSPRTPRYNLFPTASASPPLHRAHFIECGAIRYLSSIRPRRRAYRGCACGQSPTSRRFVVPHQSPEIPASCLCLPKVGYCVETTARRARPAAPVVRNHIRCATATSRSATSRASASRSTGFGGTVRSDQNSSSPFARACDGEG